MGVHAQGGGGSGSSGSGGFLGYHSETASHAYATTAQAVLVDVDAANMAVTFNAPQSGNVLVTLTAYCQSPATFFEWGLREGAAIIAGPADMNAATSGSRFTARFVLTGLVANSAHTYKWAMACTGTATIYTGGNSGVNGDALMTVEALP